MKIYLTDGQKVNMYSLPKKIEDTFFITYKSENGIEENINISAKDGHWVIESTPETSFYSGSTLIQSSALENNTTFQVKFSDLDTKVFFYALEFPIAYMNYDVTAKEEITIGKTGTSTILYNNDRITATSIQIVHQASYWIITAMAEDQEVYVNGYRCRQQVLRFGDTIFLNGLKIIWLDSYLKINIPKDKLTTTLGKYTKTNFENKYTEVTDSEKASSLYDDNQVFFHTPRLKETIKENTITIQLPPLKTESEKTPALLQLGGSLMMGLSSSITGVIAILNIVNGKATLLSSITEISICVSMLFGCILFPILLDKYQARKEKKREKKRQTKYLEYLSNKTSEINRLMEKEKQILFENNLSIAEIQAALVNRSNKIWSREISDNDFLSIRLGLGNIKPSLEISASLEDFSLDDDNLKTEVQNIVNQKLLLESVPITASLIDDKILPVIIPDGYPDKQAYIDGLLLQLITYYSGVDLKIAVITSEQNKDKWEYLKYLPHCSSNDGSEHYFATTEDEIKQLTSTLEKIRQERVKSISSGSRNDDGTSKTMSFNEKPGDLYKLFDCYYLVVTDNFISAKRHEFIDRIVESENNYGFSILMFENNMKNLPSKCNHFVDIQASVSGLFSKDLSEENQKTFVPDFQRDRNNPEYSQILANIPVIGENLASVLPTSLNFLEMYKVGKIEQLNITNRWMNNDPTQSLQAPIGVQVDGKPFELDLHEKAHGPHGLIAGATGSGKSEFIITYILSMAINYHPYEVQFVLIDYKGGGLAGAFENKESGIRLPHLAGTITNLDTAEMNRTLVSIKSELKRRQRIFNEARDSLNESTIDIYKYQTFFREKKVQEPISHLFIISDEFAELKDQQPEFMEELVSIARIGRSLGVHLILATQKPAGVVDDQIWSNARFKISLKVQTEEDSMELLKRPEAASIKETGRFYLQVGFDEIFESGQAAWAGAKYNPTDRITKVYEDDIKFIDNNGNLIKKINNAVKTDNQVNLGDQLSNIVKNLSDIAARDQIQSKTLWLPSIPAEIFIGDLIKKYLYAATPYDLNILIGEYDDPESQKQDKLSINLSKSGSILIIGNTGSGKENLLTTLLYVSCIYHSTSEINYYILDFGAEILNPFAQFPQVGDIVTAINGDKINNHFDWINRQIDKRKELFRDFGGNYLSYLKNSQKKLPLIVTIVNNYESFVDNYLDLEDVLTSQLRESAKYGIIFITTVVAANAVRPSIAQLYGSRIMTQVGDPFEYIYQLDAKRDLIPAKYFGRGVIKLEDGTFEFQTALINLKDKITETLKSTAIKLQNSKMLSASPIPNVPKYVSSENVLSVTNDIDSIPMGYNIDTSECSFFNFSSRKIHYIIGNHINTEPQLLFELIKVLSTIPSIELKVMDLADNMQECGVEAYCNNEFTNFIKNIFVAENETKQRIVYIITGIGFIYDRVLDEGIQKLFDLFEGKYNLPNSYFILSDNAISMRKLEQEVWYQKDTRTNGIWFGSGFNEQTIIHAKDIKNYDVNRSFNGMAYIVKDGEYEVVKSIGAVEQRGGYY